MATMPSRVEALGESVPSILPQCDELHVYLNNFREIPEVLKHEKITAYLASEAFSSIDLGDVGKFFKCETWNDDYHFTVDDKIIYPADYAAKCIETIEKYDGKVIVSYHGRILPTIRPCTSYYRDSTRMISLIDGTPEDVKLHVGGTGVMCFRGDILKNMSLNVFPYINMSDIWFSIYAWEKNLDIIRPKSRDRWIRLSRKYDTNYAIHSLINDEIHTKAVNNIKWK